MIFCWLVLPRRIFAIDADALASLFAYILLLKGWFNSELYPLWILNDFDVHRFSFAQLSLGWSHPNSWKGIGDFQQDFPPINEHRFLYQLLFGRNLLPKQTSSFS